MTDPGDSDESRGDDPRVDGPPDPALHPAMSPGLGEDIDGLEDIEVSRADVEIGTADPGDLTAADTEPVAEAAIESVLADLTGGTVRERQRAALALAERGDDERVGSALARSARSDPDADVRQFAVESLVEYGSSEAADVALAALSDADPWVRAEAVVALDNLGRTQFQETIADCLADDHHAVRRNALVSLWKVRGVDMVETLLSFTDDESDRVREWVATLLAEIEDERAESALRTLATDEHDVVANTASEALEGGDPGTTDVGTNVPAARSSDPEQSRHDRPPDL